MAEKFLIPYIPKLEIVKVPPYKTKTFTENSEKLFQVEY